MARKRKAKTREEIWRAAMGGQTRPVIHAAGGRVWVELVPADPVAQAQIRALYQKAAAEVATLERMWAESPDA